MNDARIDLSSPHRDKCGVSETKKAHWESLVLELSNLLGLPSVDLTYDHGYPTAVFREGDRGSVELEPVLFR